LRDKERIERICDKFKELWLQESELRFGQLIYIISNNLNKTDIFNIEDEEWENMISALCVDTLIKKLAQAETNKLNNIVTIDDNFYISDEEFNMVIDKFTSKNNNITTIDNQELYFSTSKYRRDSE
jgi:hypothetical protein